MADLFHRDFGGGGHPPLVILHGLLGSSRNWQTAGKDLASRYHVLALDLRNHGLSPHEPTMGYADMQADVLAWMDRQGLGQATVLGHSMGGKVAMSLACREPSRVAGLIVVDMAPKDYRWEAHRAEFAAMNELDLDGLASRAEAELRFEARVPDWGMRKFLTTNLERDDAGTWRWLINLPVLTQSLPILERNALPAGARYEGPTRFILGGKSRYVADADRAAISGHFPRADFVVLPQAGHNPHMDSRPAFVEAVP